MGYALELAKGQRAVMSALNTAGTAQKNQLLLAIADSLTENREAILAANQEDLALARQNGMSPSMLDRLSLNETRIAAMAGGVRKVAALADPVGEVLMGKTLENGLQLRKVRTPLGLIGIIYEARPNVTVDAAALCLKSSNAVMLRGGKEAFHTNKALCSTMRAAITACGFPADIVALVEDTSRETATEMMKLNGWLDVLIPRGGAGLIRSVVENANVPVIETGVGNCHIFVDETADLSMAVEIVNNAKTSRPSVCNACESLLVHEGVAAEFLPALKKKLDEKSVRIYGCPITASILGDSVLPADDTAYQTEFLDYALSVRVVPGINEALSHIARFSTGHSEAILTQNLENARLFTKTVDAAAVYVNASTRFTDGEEFGFGAEIGISTQKLHARGPMGLTELTSSKYIVYGDGQIR